MSTLTTYNFDVDAQGWTTIGAGLATVVRSTTTPDTGAGCLLVTATAAGNNAARSVVIPIVRAQTPITVTARIRQEGAVRPFQGYIEWTLANGGDAGGNAGGANLYDTTMVLNTYETETWTVTPPAGATGLRVVLNQIGAAVGNAFRADNIVVADAYVDAGNTGTGPTDMFREQGTWVRRKDMVRLFDSSGWVWGDVAAPPTTTAPPTPPAPTTSLAGTSVAVAFPAASNGGSPLTDRTLQRRTYTSGTPGTPTTVASGAGLAGAASYTDSGVVIGGTYDYRQQVTNAIGVSTFSAYSAQVTVPVSSAPKIGVYTSYQSTASDVAKYEAFIGRPVDYLLEFQGTEAAGNLAWPAYMSGYYTPGFMGTRKLALGASLSPTRANGPTDYYTRQQTWQQLANGAFDATWAAMAQNLVASGQATSILRGAHEFNEPMFAHRVYPGEEAAFIAAWQRWHGIVRANGHTGPIHWNPTSGDYNGNGLDVVACYPGDAYVDVIDLDLYDRWYTRGATAQAPRTLAEQQDKWTQFLTMNQPTWRGLQYWRSFAVQHGKGMAFSEWGLGAYFNDSDGNHGGGDNAYLVERMADFILDPAYPPGSPGGVTFHAFWEDAANGLRPLDASNPDSGRFIPVPNARAAFLARFGGSGSTTPPGTTTLASPATAISSTGFTSSWSSATNATSYLVQRRVGAAAFATVATVTGGTTFAHTGLTAQTAYDVRIVPRQGLVEGSASNTVTTTTSAAENWPAASTLDAPGDFTLSGGATSNATSITVPAGGTAEGRSTSLVTLVGSRLRVKLPEPTSPAAQVVRLEIDANNWIDIYRSVAYGVFLRQRANGVNAETNVAYNATTQLWASLREAGGQTYWEFSADGTTWTAGRQVANPIALTGLRARLLGFDGTAGQSVTFAFS